MNRRFITILLGLLIVIVAYHYYLGYDLSQQIGEGLQKLNQQSTFPAQIDYGDIDVSPFNGDVQITDIEIEQRNNGNHLALAAATMDLTYWDFLTLYFKGTRHGLDDLEEINIHLQQLNIADSDNENHATIQETDVQLNGTVLDWIRIFNGQPLKKKQNNLVISGNDISVSAGALDHPQWNFLKAAIQKLEWYNIEIDLDPDKRVFLIRNTSVHGPDLDFTFSGSVPANLYAFQTLPPSQFKADYTLDINSGAMNIPFSSAWGGITTNKLHWQASIEHKPGTSYASDSVYNPFLDNGSHKIRLTEPSWIPPKTIQQNYGPLFSGFGIDLSGIDGKELEAVYQYDPRQQLLTLQSFRFPTDNFTISAHGNFKLNRENVSKTDIQEATLQLSNLDPNLANAVTNLEKLFGLNLPRQNGNIVIEMEGTIGHPVWANKVKAGSR